MENNLNLELEKEHLQMILKDIVDQTNVCIQKRKSIVESIVNRRKTIIEDFEDDEDKIIEYFDHEKYIIEEAFNQADKRLKELSVLSLSPYFGSVKFEDDLGEDDIYVGRFGLLKEGELVPRVVDWRAPIASLFYAGKLGKFSYNTPNGRIEADIKERKQYIIKKAKLEGVFTSDIDIKDDILQMVLSRNSNATLKDIVSTIQKEQDEIIRQDRSGVVVVNGAAGSGKTTIALHRTAYLLYNNRKDLKDKVLILGPNFIFNDYISNVLPTLGETGVNQTTFREFGEEIIGTHNILSVNEYMEKVLNNDVKFIEDLKFKSSPKFEEYLNDYIKNLEDNLVKSKDIVYFDKLLYTKEEIDKMLKEDFKSMPLAKRTSRIRRIVVTKIRDARTEKVREIKKQYSDIYADMSEEEKKLNGNDLELKQRIKIREALNLSIELKKSLKWLYIDNACELYKVLNGDKSFTLEDIAAILYLKIKIEGYKLKNEIKHIVIDEAQDYSYIQFKVLKEITRCTSMTIVGDENQRLLPLSGELPMLNLKDIFDNVNIFNLNKSYRSTKEIIEYSNSYLINRKVIPIVRSGKNVEEFNAENYNLTELILEKIKEFEEDGLENIAIVCKSIRDCEEILSSLKETSYIKFINNEECIYNGGKIIIPSYLAKGLEFDGVIFVKNNNFEKDNFNYVTSTRALHRLVVIKK